jgi:hypothetical protein
VPYVTSFRTGRRKFETYVDGRRLVVADASSATRGGGGSSGVELLVAGLSVCAAAAAEEALNRCLCSAAGVSVTCRYRVQGESTRIASLDLTVTAPPGTPIGVRDLVGKAVGRRMSELVPPSTEVGVVLVSADLVSRSA